VAVENDAIADATCTARNNSWGHRAELVHGAAGCGTSGDARFLVAVTFAAEIGDVRRFASCALPSRERTATTAATRSTTYSFCSQFSSAITRSASCTSSKANATNSAMAASSICGRACSNAADPMSGSTCGPFSMASPGTLRTRAFRPRGRAKALPRHRDVIASIPKKRRER
jgi:hypothetical protein